MGDNCSWLFLNQNYDYLPYTYNAFDMSWFMVLNATFNNISVIFWWSVLLVEETRVHGENHQPVASHWQTLSHNVVLSGSRHERDSKIWEITVPDYFLIKINSLIQIMHSIWEITVPEYFLIKIIFPIHKNVFDMGDNCSWLFLYENYLPCT